MPHRLSLPAILWTLLTFIAAIYPAPAQAEMEIKVRIGSQLKKVDISLLAGGDLFDGKNRRVKTLRANETFVWEAPTATKPEPMEKVGKKGQKDRKPRRPPPRKKADPWLGKTIRFVARRGQVSVNRLSYHGVIWVIFGSGGAVVINQIRLDEYVRGVVGREMGSLSPLESLKAQAVMARTYAVSNRGKHGKDGFDLCNAEHCQVYGGMAAERPSTTAAVDGTKGVIMTANGFPTSIMYHATCGGSTEDNDLVYGGKPLPYLRGVSCRFCKDGTNYRWVRKLPVDLVQRRMAAEKQPFRVLKRVEVRLVKGKNRAEQVILDTDKGSIKVKGTTFRRLFSLPSTYFWLQSSGAGPTTPQAIEVPMKSTLAAKFPALSARVVLPEEVSVLLAGRRDGGPKQLVIQTGSGLSRTTRPGEGWMILAGRPGSAGSLTMPDQEPGRAPLPEADVASESRSGTSAKRALAKKPDVVPGSRKAGPVAQVREIQLQGRGYGHQVGMCQAGAIGAGRVGWNYRQILGYYFRGVALRRLP